jgi:hypothetical protein
MSRNVSSVYAGKPPFELANRCSGGKWTARMVQRCDVKKLRSPCVLDATQIEWPKWSPKPSSDRWEKIQRKDASILRFTHSDILCKVLRW